MLAPTKEAVDLLHEVGFKHLRYDDYADSIALSAAMIDMTPDGMKRLADMPGFVGLHKNARGNTVITLEKPAIVVLPR